MDCPQCSHQCPPEYAFCPKCGAALQRACPNCGHPTPAGFAFCPMCGSALSAAPPETAEESEPAAAVQALKRLTPAAYAERLLAAGGQLAGERRLVTILFSDIKGSTAMAEQLDPEVVMEIMDDAFDVLIEPIMRYEGTLARLMGDAILAFFGAPTAHEDDPERACRAALDIVAGAQQHAARLEKERGISGFNVRVGVNTGLVVVGEVGSDLRVEYTAMGDAINLAARMEQHAPAGGILITHDTYRHIRGIFDVQAQDPLTVKGKAQPVQTYVVLQAKPRAFRMGTRGVEGVETRMIGRDAELKRLQDALYAAIEDGERQVVTIVGDAGVGKSRLLYEFDNWLLLLPETIRYFKGRARQEMQNVPYALLRDLFAFRFQIQDSDSAQMVRQKMIDGIAEVLVDDQEAEKKAHLIGQLIGFDFSGSHHLQDLRDDPQALHDQALAHMAEFFRLTSKLRPTALILEDLHWADDSSLDVINHLVEALPQTPLLIVTATRPALFQRRPHWSEGQVFHRRLELEPLSNRESRQLVLDILQRVEDVPGPLRDLVVTGAEGNPFFIEELIKMLIEDGVIIIKGPDAWRVEPERLADVRVPQSLTGVLQARLDRLPLGQRAILQQASVVGRLFWDRAVAHIGEGTPDGLGQTAVANGLMALRDRELVFRRETSTFADAGEYIFKHALLREITYASVLKRLRRIYHGLVADWLMDEAGDRVGEHIGLIADHLEAAGRIEEACERLLEAGDQARLLYAHEEAIAYYERALALLKGREDLEQAAQTLMKLGLTYHNAFDYQRSRQAYDEGFSLWQKVEAAAGHGVLLPAPHAYRVGGVYVAITVDPAKATDAPSGYAVRQLFGGLVEESAEHEDVMPDVARSWEILEGGRRYVFHLRDDVHWSDGKLVTAFDFEYAWKRVLDPNTTRQIASQLYGVRGARAFHEGMAEKWDSVGIRAVSESTLLVELERPIGYFLQMLVRGQCHPVPRHVVAQHGDDWTRVQHIVSNGPFLLETLEPGRRIVHVRNPTYHGRFRGNVWRVEHTYYEDEGDARAGLALYEADELDVLYPGHLPLAERRRASQRHAAEHRADTVPLTYYVGFNTRRAPFDDVRVRQALVLAVDRARLVAEAFGSEHVPATGGFVPPGIAGHSPDIGLPYDPKQALRLLAVVGYAEGAGFPAVHSVTSEHYLPECRQLQMQWRQELGIEVRWEVVRWGAYQELLNTAPPPIFPMGWRSDYPDPDSHLRVGFPQHSTGWCNETYARLIHQAGTLTDQKRRMALYRQADQILMEEAVIMPLYYARWYGFQKPWVVRAENPKDITIKPH